MLSMQDTFLLLNIVRLSHLMELEEPTSQSLRALQQILSLQSLHKSPAEDKRSSPPGESWGLCRKEDSETSDEFLLPAVPLCIEHTAPVLSFIAFPKSGRLACLF